MRARNAQGQGEWSFESGTGRAAAPPSAPRNVEIAFVRGFVRPSEFYAQEYQATWSPPATTYGLPVVRYDYQNPAESGGGGIIANYEPFGLIRSTTERQWTTNIHSGSGNYSMIYATRVRAVTAAGASPWSDWVFSL